MTKFCTKACLLSVIVIFLFPILLNAQECDQYKIKIKCPPVLASQEMPPPNAYLTLDVELDLAERQNAIRFCLPAFGQRFGERLSKIEFWNGEHKTNAVVLDARACSKMAQTALSKIRYRIEMRPLSEMHFWAATSLSANANNQSLAMAGESLFVEILEDEKKTKTVRTCVSVESHCKVFSTLNVRDVTVQSSPIMNSHFEAEDAFNLIRSYWTFGNYHLLMAKRKNLSLMLLADADWPVDVGIVGREVMAIIEQFEAMFAEKMPEKLSVFLFSSDYDLQMSDGFARPGGVVLQMGAKAARDPSRRRILLAHELFHLINGEGLRYKLEDFEETAWFREGITQYMAAKALCRAGLMSHSAFLDMLAKSSVRVLEPANEAFGPRCYSREGIELRDGHAYHLGFVLAYAIEQQWRLYETAFTLEGFWEALYAKWPKSARLGQVELRDALERYSGFDFSAFFEQVLATKSKIPVEAILARDGLCLKRTVVPHYDIGMRYVFNSKLARIMVRELKADMPAALAGLRVGDVIVPSADTDWNDASDKRLFRIRGASRQALKIPVHFGKTVDVRMGKCDAGDLQSP